jgi:signal transduction histidine kinase
LNGLALTYKELEQYDEAIRAAQQSIAISKKFSYRDKTKESYGILYEIYEEKHDFHDALLNYKLFNLYQDSIFNEDNLEYIENLKIQYEMEHVKTENELLRKDAELKDSNLAQQRKLTFLGSIALLSLIGAILFLYYGSRQKKKRNHFLAEFNKNLQEQVEERTKELVKSNLELIRQNNQLQQYGYITAHNLRAPVARILGLTNILKSDQLNPDEDLLIVDKLRRTTLELDTIIHDMNAILDIKNGVENSYEVVDFHERLDKIKKMLKDSIANTHTSIQEDFTAAKSTFSIPAYIESILYNLISNAIKYRSSKRTPEIIVRSGITDGLLELTVSDNGMGIEPHLMKDKIFNLYQRFHDHVEGKGMGLFLVKTQVEALNGNISIESTVNKGTTFHITIPLVVRS